ncbi:MAG: helix-turn-helix transcriptional regulator [Desulfarculus sp.]|nr:helix-turn-helix transcriptional regulator [Desulfarculus sp.]
MPLGTDDIWAELARRRITASAIGRALNVSPSTVTRAINGDTREPGSPILIYIATLLGVTAEELKPGQPSFYSKHIAGQARRSTRKVSGVSAPPACHSEPEMSEKVASASPDDDQQDSPRTQPGGGENL